MHELSIAYSIVGTVSEAAEQAGAERVDEVHLRVGVLAGVTKDSLVFCYDIATEGTRLAGSKLIVTEIPVSIFCPVCREEKNLEDFRRFRCPACDTPSADLRHGRELDIDSVIVNKFSII